MARRNISIEEKIERAKLKTVKAKVQIKDNRQRIRMDPFWC